MKCCYRQNILSAVAVVLAAALMCPLIVQAQSAADKFTVPGMPGFYLNAAGVFRIDGLGFEVIHFDDAWKKTLQKDLTRAENYPRYDAAANAWETRGALASGTAHALVLSQRFKALSPSSFQADWEASSDAPEGIPSREISLQCDFPVSRFQGRSLLLDGAAYSLPAAFENQNVFSAASGRHSLSLPGTSGTLVVEGDFSVVLQDNRKWNAAARSFTLRIRFLPQRSPLKKASLGITIRYEPAPAGAGYVPLTIKPGEDWAPYKHSLDIRPGGIFDFSQLLDAPAGKHGALRATSRGHLEFMARPGQPVRFQGVNFTFDASFPASLADAELIADRLARSGYNSVRFHHMERQLVKKGGPSYELDPDALDQLEVFFAALKRRGIYINIDLYSARSFTREELASFGLNPQKNDEFTKYLFKGIIPVSDAAFDNWARYAGNLLTHRNPHTGLTWAEDSALIGICPVNEDSAYLRADRSELAPLYRKAYERDKDAAWRERPRSSDPKADYNRFVVEVQIRSDQRNTGFIRKLGCQALVTGANHRNALALVPIRQQFDYVDNHQYLDHPSFPGKRWGLPFAFTQAGATRQHALLPRLIMPTRIMGKPFAVTEFSYVRPNRHRAEGAALLMPAYASLQDWSALYNFQYAMDRTTALVPGVENYFALTADPVNLIADRVGALLFLRRDIAPATGSIVFAVQPQDVGAGRTESFPADFSRIGLITRVGSRYAATPDALAAIREDDASVRALVTTSTKAEFSDLAATLKQSEALATDAVDETGNRYRSETGEIELDAAAGLVRVVTPRNELFLLQPGMDLAGDRASVTADTAAMVGVISMDSARPESALPLSASRRLLVLHLTDALPEGMQFARQDRKLLDGWGRLPHLVQRGGARLKLRLPEPGAWRAWAVDSEGNRVSEIKLDQEDGGIALHLSSISATGTQLAYELVR